MAFGTDKYLSILVEKGGKVVDALKSTAEARFQRNYLRNNNHNNLYLRIKSSEIKT